MGSQDGNVEEYRRLLSELLERRQLLGTLSDDEEAERAGEMEDVWRLLDAAERAQIEAWIAEMQSKPGLFRSRGDHG